MGSKGGRSESSKKADRKFEKKLQFYSKVREIVASLSAKKAIEKKNKNSQRRQKKLKAYDLSSLADFLHELKEPQQPAPPPNSQANCKSSQKLVLKEAKQLRTVLSHPVFQLDPLAAIHLHLKGTQQPALDKKPVKKSRRNQNLHQDLSPWKCEC